MKEYLIIMGTVAVAVAGALWMANVRTDSNCESAKCPEGGPITLEARIGQEVSGLGVGIIPTDLLEDSRCPVDVACIRAGTVRVQARLTSDRGEADQELKLNQPITIGTQKITLVQVMPQPSAGVETEDSAYILRFEISKR